MHLSVRKATSLVDSIPERPGRRQNLNGLQIRLISQRDFAVTVTVTVTATATTTATATATATRPARLGAQVAITVTGIKPSPPTPTWDASGLQTCYTTHNGWPSLHAYTLRKDAKHQLATSDALDSSEPTTNGHARARAQAERDLIRHWPDLSRVKTRIAIRTSLRSLCRRYEIARLHLHHGQ